MQTARLLAGLRAEGERLVDAARIDLNASVSACPGWNVADVLGHLGRVYWSIHDIVVQQAQEPPTTPVPKPPPGPEVIDFFVDAHRALLESLGSAAPATPVYTWSDDRTVAFYQRRMVHETTVHRIDVERAVGRPITAVDADLAADGIDELVSVVLPFGLARASAPSLPVGSLHLHRTDGDGEWTLAVIDGVVQVGHVHAKATAALRGPASDLFIFVWNRGGSALLECFGDESVAAAWSALAP